MELRDGLEVMSDHHLTDDLDELQARMQMIYALVGIWLTFVATITWQWVNSLEGTMQ